MFKKNDFETKKDILFTWRNRNEFNRIVAQLIKKDMYN